MQNQENSFEGSDVELTGVKVGEVISNLDPRAAERVFVRILGVHDMSNTSPDNGIWANNCAASRFMTGDIPEPGDFVYVMFLNPNDPMACIWLGWVRTMV